MSTFLVARTIFTPILVVVCLYFFLKTKVALFDFRHTQVAVGF